MPPKSIASAWVSLALAAGGILLGGCTGRQSAIEPAGRSAHEIAALFWWMTGGAFAIWAAVVGLTIYAVRARPVARRGHAAAMLIIGGGAVLPTVVLAGLLVYGLAMLPRLLASAPEGSLKISVVGEQWWWRVRYELPGSEPVHLANEIRLPAGEPVQFELESPDVIHSFWIPALGGKMDMIPGRKTRLTLEPTRPGTYRGACAEYCGTAHALMAFNVVVLEQAEFAQWLEAQRAAAVEPGDPLAVAGRERFLANGCAACHTIRGTGARGLVGPDLTHVGSRMTIGAGLVPNNRAALIRWIAETQVVKPGVHMPHFGMLPRGELDALAAYLETLR